MSTERDERDDEAAEPPPDDVADLPANPGADGADGADDDPDTDAMGINDDDPIDATLVGKPLDADEEPPD
jgi:hypothetical protein